MKRTLLLLSIFEQNPLKKLKEFLIIMHSTKDPDYSLTKEIKRGKATMPEDLIPLADWIGEEYDVRPINITYDVLNQEVPKPKLQIIFEWKEEADLFYTKNLYMFDKNKQKAIGKAYLSMIKGSQLSHKYLAEKPFVIFGSFEQVARQEVHERISREDIQKLKQEIDYEGLWEIHGSFGSFFVYTDKQVHECVLNGQKELWTDKYFRLLKLHDEFNYFKRDNFTIHIDSKENLDKNYNGNWYYYYK